MILTYDISDLQPYINWVYFYFAWQLKDKAEQQRIRSEAEAFLQECQGRYQAYALFQIVKAHAEGDDIVIDRGKCKEEGGKCKEECGKRIPLLRQQEVGTQFLCLADFLSTIHQELGLFATSVDAGMEHDFDNDPYQKMMAQLLADRLAEAAAERMHEEVRKHYWGYAMDEHLSIEQMQQEQFQGIRPAVGYPSLPDASLNFVLDELLGFQQIGISLTESGAMRPHASVSGLMLAAPESHYFSVGRIGEDQLADYARRRQMPIDQMRKFLTANL
jgi:cobalamin-dependent methionine synthase I